MELEGIRITNGNTYDRYERPKNMGKQWAKNEWNQKKIEKTAKTKKVPGAHAEALQSVHKPKFSTID